MEPHPSAKQGDPNPKPALLALAAICAAIVAYGYFVPGDAPENLGHSVGYKLPFGLVIWRLFRWTVGKTLPRLTSLLAFVVIQASLVAGAYVSGQKQRAAAVEMIGRIQSEYRDITQAATGSDGLPQKIEKPVAVTATAKGEIGEVEKLIRQLMADMVAQRNEYFSALEAAGWNRILDANRIRHDADLRESQQIVAAARSLLEKYDDKSRALLDTIPAKIKALNTKESTKLEMIRGFEKTTDTTRSQMREHWALERRAMAEIEGAALVLGSSRGKWSFKDGNFIFTDRLALDSFNSRMTAVRELSKQQAELQRHNAADALSNMERMKQ